MTGQPISGGIISADQNTKLGDVRSRMEQYELMLATDTVISAVTDAVRNILLSARFEFAPQEGGSQEPADFLNEAFGVGAWRGAGQMAESWESSLERLLGYRDFGFAYGEEIYRVDGGQVWLDRWAEMRQAAHWRWVMDENGGFAGVQQIDPSGYAPFNRTGAPQPIVPANKMILLTHRGHSNFEGQGTLRAAWIWWRTKTLLVDMLAIAAERMAVPTPLLTIDPEQLDKIEALIWSKDDRKDAVDEIKTMLGNYTSHQSAFMVTYKGLDLDSYGGDVDLDPMLKALRHANQELLVCWLAPHLGLGTWSEAGSRALGESQTGFMRSALANSLEYVSSVIGGRAGPGRGTAGRLLEWNLGSVTGKDFPVLRHDGVDEDKMGSNMGKIPGLVSSGCVTPTNDVEASFRRFFRWEPLPEDQKRTPEERLETATTNTNVNEDETSATDEGPDSGPDEPRGPAE